MMMLVENDEMMTRKEAARYLGMSERWLADAKHVPAVDMRQPGAKKASWRYSKKALDKFMADRTKIPGHPSPANES